MLQKDNQADQFCAVQRTGLATQYTVRWTGVAMQGTARCTDVAMQRKAMWTGVAKGQPGDC